MIRAAINDRVLHLVFEDSKSRNSFSLAAAHELRRALVSHPGQFDAIVFEAEGRVFCSGGNLTDYSKMTDPEQGKLVNREITTVLNELALMPVPTFCLVNGDCFGGGVEILSAFDFIYTAPHAFFALWQRKIGLSFGWGGGARLERRLGLANLRRLAISTDTLGAHEALRLGLVDRIVLQSELHAEVSRVLAGFRSLPRAPVAALKKWTSETELATFEGLWWNEQHRAVLAARRRPT